jgi:hypothetical protein
MANISQINGLLLNAATASFIPGVSTLAGVQLVRTSSYTTTNTFTNLTFSDIAEQSNPTVVYRDNTNQDRVYVTENGLYQIAYHASVGAAATNDFTFRIVKNNASTVSGSESNGRSSSTDRIVTSAQILTTLAANDYITLQARYTASAGNAGTVEPSASLFVIKMNGITGAAGPSGSTFPYTGSARITGSLNVIGTTIITGSLIASGSSHDLRAVNNVNIQTPRIRIYDPTATIGSSDNLYLNTTNVTGGLYWSTNDEIIANFNQTNNRFNYGNSNLYVSGSDGKTYSSFGFVGPLQGTASFATTASFALAVAGGGGGGVSGGTTNFIPLWTGASSLTSSIMSYSSSINKIIVSGNMYINGTLFVGNEIEGIQGQVIALAQGNFLFSGM